jgi:hypothetical protein
VSGHLAVDITIVWGFRGVAVATVLPTAVITPTVVMVTIPVVRRCLLLVVIETVLRSLPWWSGALIAST